MIDFIIQGAKEMIENLSKDLMFLKDQITVSEVNIARLHNHKVQLNQKAKVESAK